MRRVMQENTQMNEEYAKSAIRERNAYADRLVEKWAGKKGLDLGEKMFDLHNESPEKARNLAVVLESQEKHLKRLTETQISDTFSTTPQNIIKIIRLGYPNSVRSEIFREFSMQTMKDTIYKLAPIYASTQRGATAGNLVHESEGNRYPTEIEYFNVTGANGTLDEFTGTLTVKPLRPWTLQVFVDGEQVGADIGDGRIQGPGMDADSTVNYTSGAFELNFSSAPADGAEILVQYAYNMEHSDLYTTVGGEVELALTGVDFRAHPYPIGFSFSHMAQLIMEDALSVDAQEALVSGGADMLKKSLDYIPLKMAMRASTWSAPVEFNADWSAQGAASAHVHAQGLNSAIDLAGNKMYDAMNRGGVSVIVGGPSAITYAKKNLLYTPEGRQAEIGAHRVGTLDGRPLYKVPKDIVPDDELLCVFKNDKEDSLDVPIALGTYIPLYRTAVNEYNTFQKSGGMAYYGDMKLMEKRYLTRVKIVFTQSED